MVSGAGAGTGDGGVHGRRILGTGVLRATAVLDRAQFRVAGAVLRGGRRGTGVRLILVGAIPGTGGGGKGCRPGPRQPGSLEAGGTVTAASAGLGREHRAVRRELDAGILPHLVSDVPS